MAQKGDDAVYASRTGHTARLACAFVQRRGHRPSLPPRGTGREAAKRGQKYAARACPRVRRRAVPSRGSLPCRAVPTARARSPCPAVRRAASPVLSVGGAPHAMSSRRWGAAAVPGNVAGAAWPRAEEKDEKDKRKKRKWQNNGRIAAESRQNRGRTRRCASPRQNAADLRQISGRPAAEWGGHRRGWGASPTWDHRLGSRLYTDSHR